MRPRLTTTRPTTRPTPRLLAGALGLTLALAACGGDSEGGDAFSEAEGDTAA